MSGWCSSSAGARLVVGWHGEACAPSHEERELAEPMGHITSRQEAFLREHRPTPYLVVDLDIVAERYRALVAALPATDVFYAVKANPAPEVISLLVSLG